MDVLAYWTPQIDWTRFRQGGLADAFWQRFKQLVMLCHAYKHWDDASNEAARTRPPKPFYPESRYGRSKRLAEHARGVEEIRDHKYRAAYLACDKIAELSKLFEVGTILSPQGPEWRCYLALHFAVEPLPQHERSHCRAAAFENFDADAELVGEPLEIARRWRHAAGDALREQ